MEKEIKEQDQDQEVPYWIIKLEEILQNKAQQEEISA